MEWWQSKCQGNLGSSQVEKSKCRRKRENSTLALSTDATCDGESVTVDFGTVPETVPRPPAPGDWKEKECRHILLLLLLFPSRRDMDI